MQSLFIALLIGVLLTSLLSFAVMGWRRRRRVSQLARHAHQLRLRFAPSDPFAVARRYGQFDVIASGHGAHACNVTYGRLAGWSVRAFDFHYELGHGTHRATREYGVIVAQTDRALPEGLFWHERDLDQIPLSGRRCRRRRGCWHCDVDAHAAATLAEAVEPLAETGASFQTVGSTMLLFVPPAGRHVNYSAALDALGEVLGRLDGLTDSQGPVATAPTEQIPPGGPLQNGPERDTTRLGLPGEDPPGQERTN